MRRHRCCRPGLHVDVVLDCATAQRPVHVEDVVLDYMSSATGITKKMARHKHFRISLWGKSRRVSHFRFCCVRLGENSHSMGENSHWRRRRSSRCQRSRPPYRDAGSRWSLLVENRSSSRSHRKMDCPEQCGWARRSSFRSSQRTDAKQRQGPARSGGPAR